MLINKWRISVVIKISWSMGAIGGAVLFYTVKLDSSISMSRMMYKAHRHHGDRIHIIW